MTQTITIRFTEPQIALVMRAHPNCNLDRLAELSFEFDQAGKIIDCTGTIKDGGSMDHDYAGSGLARLYCDGTPSIDGSTNQRDDIAFFERREACQCVEMIPRKSQAPKMYHGKPVRGVTGR